MVRLSECIEQADRLDVLAASRRQFEFQLISDRPLRKGTTAKAKRDLARLRSMLAGELSSRLDAQSRSRFRGRIAVEMRIETPPGRHAARVATIVKDYVDLLTGAVVTDDQCVDHLLVLRGESPDELTRVRVRCLPLSIFIADFDRAFRVAAEGVPRRSAQEQEASFRDGAPVARARPWGYASFDEYARESLAYDESLLAIIEDLDAEEEEQLEEDPDCSPDVYAPAGYEEFEDPLVRDQMRDQLRDAIQRRRGDWLADQGVDMRDRPGPPRAWVREALAHTAVDLVALDDRGPGCFVLPPPRERETPAGEEHWWALMRRALAIQVGWRWRSARFTGPVGLDIALRGGAGDRADVDNVARGIVRAFESVFAAEVAGFRVYRKVTPGSKDIRVRVTPCVRLEALADAMQVGRDIVLSDATRLRG